MTRLRGADDESWSLSEAVDALGEAARNAGRPGWIWIAGILYPGLNLGLLTAAPVLLRTEDSVSVKIDTSGFAMPLEALGAGPWFAMFVVLLPIYSRLTAGLARIAPPDAWARAGGPLGRPRLRQSWRAGRGITSATLGMWILLATLFLTVALAVFTLVARVASAGGGMIAVLVAPPVLLLSLYALAISILHQLALHSLTHNRRGVGSALVHAWSVARHDPWATGRTVALDVVLQLFVFGASLAIWLPLDALGLGALAVLPGYALQGFAGVTRAGFWARAYRGLGGLSPADGVPGLPVGERCASHAPDAPTGTSASDS